MASLQALGMVETKGLVAAIEAADAMVKAANVTDRKRKDWKRSDYPLWYAEMWERLKFSCGCRRSSS